MNTTPVFPRGASFSRKRAARTVSGAATAGLMVGLSLAGASSASAATDADCDGSNTVDATAAGTALDIQTLMDSSTPVICLSGTFVLSDSLYYDYDLTIHGLTNAVLDGDGVTRILDDDDNDTLTVENLTFRNGSTGGDGGAIYGATVIVHNSQFLNNEAFLGGAIIADYVELYDSYFAGNDAGLLGGAVASGNSTIATRTTFSNNNAGDAGGAIFSYGLVTSDSSTFEENYADAEGGAILAVDGIEVQNSTLVGNEVDGSGASTILAAAGFVRQSTFLNNSSGSALGSTITAIDGALELRGNIFAGSGATADLREDGGTFPDAGANLFTTADEPDLSSVQASTQFGVTTVALFAGATLADNGGPTQTVALHAASPALSAVPAGATSMTVDQRGVARPAISDAGAYEYADSDAASGGAELAATGSESTPWLVGAAGVLLLGGVTAMGLARRRSRRSV